MGNRLPVKGLMWLFLGALLLTLAVGCGGGGGGGTGSDYEGNRNAAVVSGDNAPVLAATAYDSRSLEASFGGIASLTDTPVVPAGAPEGRPVLLTLYRAFVRGITDMDMDSGTMAAATPIRSLNPDLSKIDGDCGGSYSIDLQLDNSSGVFSGTFIYADYCTEDTVIDGLVVVSGRMDPDTSKLDFIDFNFSSLSGARDGEGFRLDGSVRLTAIEATDTNQVSMDLLFEDLDSGETLWLKDFVVSVTDGNGYEEIAFSGRIYHPVHGYVDLSTEVPFRLEDGADNPSEGVLLLTGADNGKILMTVISESQYQVEADTDGDDTYDWGPQTYAWDS
jgi:hypothetical protein